MKRAGMSLRSSTNIQPQLTNVERSGGMQQASPFKQDEVEEAKFNRTLNPDGSINIDKNKEGETTLTPKVHTGIGACDKLKKGDNLAPNSAACLKYKKSAKKCEGLSQEELMDPANDCTGHAMDETTTPDVLDEASGIVQGPGGTTPRTNILTPREMRRNMRMRRFASDGSERLKKKANRNIRQAIRRGESPDQGDLDILSGEDLGNLDGINIMQDSTGTTNLFTKQQTSAFQQNPGGETIDPQVYQKELDAQLTLIEQGDVEYDDMEATMKAAEAATQASLGVGSKGQSGVEQGQYLTNRTRRTMRRNNADMEDAGVNKNDKVSERKRDSNKRKVTKYKDKLKGSVDAEGNYVKKEGGISKKKYDRLKRKAKDKGGDVSAFKKKGSPMHMTVNVTKPSYKMGGFGSK